MVKLQMKIPQTTSERIADVIGIIAILFMLIYTFMKYSGLPDTVPIHFGANGEADGFGSKITFIIWPAISIGMFIFLTILERYPQAYNYPARLNEQNAEAFYRNARKMLNYIKNIIAILFAYVTYEILNLNGKLSPIFWILMALIFIVVIVGAIRQRKIN